MKGIQIGFKEDYSMETRIKIGGFIFGVDITT